MNPILGKRQYLIAALLFAAAPACLAQGVLAEWNLAATPLSSAVVPSTVNVTSATSITFGGYAGQWSEPASGVLREGPGATTTPALAVASGDYATFTLTDTTPMDLTQPDLRRSLCASLPTRPVMPWNRAWMDLRHM